MIDELKRRERLVQLLRTYRREQGVSKRELSRRSGVDSTSMLSYLEGLSFPGEFNQKKIAQMLGITHEELMARLDDRELTFREDVEYICQQIRLMSRDDFRKVYETVVHRSLVEMGMEDVSVGLRDLKEP